MIATSTAELIPMLLYRRIVAIIHYYQLVFIFPMVNNTASAGPKYNAEQIADIKSRIEAAHVYLRENDLDVAAYVETVNLALHVPELGDVFVNRTVPMLKDTRYEKKSPILSPIQSTHAEEGTATDSEQRPSETTDEAAQADA